MAKASGINNSTAAQLSQATYDTLAPDNLPRGWVDDFQYYYNDGKNSFSTFVNDAAHQVVIAFEGTQTEAQLVSDVTDAGGSAWESLKRPFATILAQIREQFPDDQIFTDGHSLGGGLAQTAALENKLSGFGQNALPISPDAIHDINAKRGLHATLTAWKNSGATFSEATVSNDITTIAYAGDLNLYSNAVASPSTSNTTLPNIYAGLEDDASDLAAQFQLSKSATVYALAAEGAHSIANVVDQLGPNPSAAPNVPVNFVTTDQSDLDALPSGFNIVDTATNVASGFNALNADVSHIQSVTLSDPGVPVVDLDFSQAIDSALLSKIGGAYDVSFSGVTGESFSSYQLNYVNGLLAATKYFSPDAPNHMTEMDFNSAGGFFRSRDITSGIEGQAFTGEEMDFGANGNLRRDLLTGISGQPYTAMANDFNKAGEFTGVTYDLTSALEDPYTSGSAHYDAAGDLRWETADLNNGGRQITGVADGVKLASHGNDVMTGGGANEKFVFSAVFGAGTITDLASHASGAGHDTISLSRADFADFAAVLASATNSGGSAVLHTADSQTITLLGVNVATLSHLSADFKFYG
jgi:hypothetical protein